MFKNVSALGFIFLLISQTNFLYSQQNTGVSEDSISITEEYIMEQVSKGMQYTLVLLKKGSKDDQNQEEANKILMAHLHHLFKLKIEGKMLLAGPIDEDGELRGICIYNLTDKEEVKKYVEEDPAVKSGRLSYEIYPWFGIPGDGLPEE
jgi:uncharacterized protein YciI